MPAEPLVLLLSVTMIISAALLWKLPVGTCSQCSHCAAERLARERADAEQAGRFYGIPICRTCGRYHAREGDHRT